MTNPIPAQTHMTIGFSNLLGFGVSVDPKQVMAITLWVTGLLCLLNIALAILYRARNRREVVSYYVACFFELAVFVFALLFFLGTITQAQIPYPLPPGLPINRAEMAAALAVGIGLFPAAFWHRINLSELPGRIAADGKTMKQSAAGVRIKQPEEWMN